MSRSLVLPLFLAGCTYLLGSPCDEEACSPSACVAGACEPSCDPVLPYAESGEVAVSCATGYACSSSGSCEVACDDDDCSGHLACDPVTNACRDSCLHNSDCAAVLLRA